MAEAIFAGEQVKELASHNASRLAAFSLTILPGFAKYFFVGYSPCDAGNRNCQQKKPHDLETQFHLFAACDYKEKFSELQVSADDGDTSHPLVSEVYGWACPARSDCTRRPSLGLCSLTNLEAALAHPDLPMTRSRTPTNFGLPRRSSRKVCY